MFFFAEELRDYFSQFGFVSNVNVIFVSQCMVISRKLVIINGISVRYVVLF